MSNDTANVSGVLGKKAYQRLKKTIQNNPNLTTLTLLDVPGSINDEYNILSSYLVHENKLNTCLLSHSTIASGGVDFFLSGNKRNVEEGAKLGVHCWSDAIQDGADFPKGDSLHNLFLNFYNKIDIDTSFYWFTLQVADAKSIHWLTNEEMIRFEVIKN
jgi:hypothetical protein